jgi:hypothetical protein
LSLPLPTSGGRSVGMAKATGFTFSLVFFNGDMKIIFLCDVTLNTLEGHHQYFEGICYLHFQDTLKI